MKNTIILAVATLFLVNAYTSLKENKTQNETKSNALLNSVSAKAASTGGIELGKERKSPLGGRINLLSKERKPLLSCRFNSGNILVITYKGVTEDDFTLKAVKQEILVKEKPARSKIALPQTKNQVVELVY